MRCAFALGILTALTAAPASANEDDFNIWGAQFASIDITDDVYIRGEAQERFTNDADRLGQLLLRSFVGYRISKRVDLGGGYAYILTDPEGPAEVNEHRFYQELNIHLVEKGGLTLHSRTRLEQRTFEEDGELAWRFRNFVQLRAPLNARNKLVVYTEPLVALNETPVQRGGLALWRNFAGISIPIARGVEAVPGYLNQHVFRDGRDRSDHIANVMLFMNF
ncbi:MAG: DUF2490 domain-containing protein [Erythrobacter sp.]|uniref:DUF2490 domain-containing protein n=1 Tax=Erythrobacter sp. TaxID=1042 RepID=UPI00261F20E6|nr:DUF2490 domain-containing protein [Erythrobacter sp.]MDJ0978810.1 DUF2490 domain-containing protein [Erythrobacter sp.]